MGTLVDGQWQSEQLFPTDKKGSFIRKDSVFQQSVSNTDPVYKPESNRYHLYVSYACPWAHRTLIMRSLKSLDAHIGISVVCPDMLENGWTFSTKHPDTTGDRLYQHRYLYQLYQQAKKNLNTRVTVPVLWDKQTKTIVNNESSQIIRIFNSEFNTLTGNDHNYYPDALKKSIDQWNQQNYDTVIEVLDTFIDQTSNILSGEVLTDTAVRDQMRSLERARCIAEQCNGGDEWSKEIEHNIHSLKVKCKSQLTNVNRSLQCDIADIMLAELGDDLIDCSSMIEGKQIGELSDQLMKIDESLSRHKGFILGKSADSYFEKVRDYCICVIKLIEISYELSIENRDGQEQKEQPISGDIAVQLLSRLSETQLLNYILLLDSEAQESGLVVENKDIFDVIGMVEGLIEAVIRSENRDDLIGKNWQWIKDKVLSPLLNHMRSRIGYKQLSLLYFCVALCSERDWR